jgi:hypothetical protein
MRERLRIIGGDISFKQLEPSGTEIDVWVPLVNGGAESDAQGADAVTS